MFRRAWTEAVALAAISVLALAFASCGGGGGSSSPPPQNQNPVPVLSSISPSSANAGDAGFTLTVNGSSFVSTSKVRWGGADRSTTFVSSAELHAEISAADVASGATINVTVFNPAPGGGTSSPQTFTTTNPAPSLANISPTSATAGGGDFSLTVNGNNFVPDSVVRWNGSGRETQFRSSTRLTATVLASDIALAGASDITVYNPPPGGGATSSAPLLVSNPSPTVSSIWPSNQLANSSAFTLVVSGSGFVMASAVRWNGLERATTYVRGNELRAAIRASDIAVAGGNTVTVFNDAPGGGLSNPATFTTLRSNNACTAGTTAGTTQISNGRIRASISPYGDVDVYSFHGTAGHQVTIEIFAQQLDLDGNPNTRDSWLDSVLELLDDSCPPAAFNGQGTLAWDDDITSGTLQDSLIQNYTLPYTGLYFIRVRDFRGDGRPDFVYDLSLSGAD
jgi:hypothetical protein